MVTSLQVNTNLARLINIIASMQPTVWRFVEFASAVVGLLCYALSSSFNHLFGDWNLFKIFLYSVFSFIICLMIFYANIRQDSRSLRFKAHTAFLVLTITSVYSFFSDKAMNGKPDAYNLISCAAFAIMSLSLSRQPRCGFEVDLLYFFLGCLIVQLMKIKLLLAIVGAGFSYSIIIFRSSFSSINAAAGNRYSGLQDEGYLAINMDSQQIATTDVASMMEQLRTCVKALQQENLNIIRMLSEQMREYIVDDSELLEADHNFMIDALPSETINDLQETAKLLVSAGSEKECSEEYSSCRKEWLEEFLMNEFFGLRKLSIEDVHSMPFKDFKNQIEKWNKASNVALKILFPSERRLCDRVFSGLSSASDFSFTEVCRESTSKLLNFANAIADGSRSPERLFKFLVMFETLRDLIPEFELRFTDQCIVWLRNEVVTIWKRLGEAIRGIFMELNNLIHQDQEKKLAVPGCGLHPIAVCMMNYLHAACRSQRTLEQVFEDSSLSVQKQMHCIMEQLESNLEAKSKFYEDPALGYYFLTINGTYIVQRAKDRGLRTLLGDDWIRKHAAKVSQYIVQYERTMGTIIHTSMQDLPGPGSYVGDVQQLGYRGTQRIGEIGGRDVQGSERSNGSEEEMQEIEALLPGQAQIRVGEKYPRKKTRVISPPARQFGNAEMLPEDGFNWRELSLKSLVSFHSPRWYKRGLKREEEMQKIEALLRRQAQIRVGEKYPQKETRVISPPAQQFGKTDVLRFSYKCPHGKLYECLAIKEVEVRADNLHDDNPSMPKVRYIGDHTCKLSTIEPSLFSLPWLAVVNIPKDMTQTTMPPEFYPSSTSVSAWLLPVNFNLSGGSVSNSSDSAWPSTSKHNKVGKEAMEVQNRLGEPSRDLFLGFWNFISGIPEAELDAPADGGHHPLMDNVVGYLQEYPIPNGSNGAGTSTFIAQMERRWELLEIILLAKSEKYKDPALRHFFMVNNWWHLLEMIQSLKIKGIFDHACLKNNRAKVEQHFELYQRSSWNRLLDLLKLDNNESVAPNIESMKNKLHLFNEHFRETCSTQCTWSVHDMQLRKAIIKSLENILLPAYGIFYKRFIDTPKNQADDYIEYELHDIPEQLNCLFV